MSKTRSEVEAANVESLLRSRHPLLWVVTREEARVEGYLFAAALAAGYIPRTWDIAQGVANMDGTVERKFDAQDPSAAMTIIATRALVKGGLAERGVWIMRDLPVWISGPAGAQPMRQLRNLARSLPGISPDPEKPTASAQAIIVISPNGDVPAELAGHTTVIDWPMPDRQEIANILDGLIEEYDLKELLTNGNRERAIDAAIGLSGEEAQACYGRSLVQSRTVDPAVVSKEKKRVIARERVLEWYDPIPGGLDAVGGLDNLKNWLKSRACAYTVEARAYGLPRPKGTMLVGISGCGKSLTAKAIATAWQCPLLRVDLGALKSKFVGESEQNLRKVFKVIETIGFCVVWFDEVEKSLQGATSGSADGGVSSDAMGAVLTWMQERTSDAFVIMTANDVSALPPEFLRKGRFDELWWIDLPTLQERAAIMQTALAANGRTKHQIDVLILAQTTEGFTGSEIAAIVPDAMFTAFSDGGREITTADLVAAAKLVVPLSKTADKKITAMREQAAGRFRAATQADETTGKKKPARVLDIA